MAGRPKKVVEETTKVVENKEEVVIDKEKEDLKAQNEKMAEMLKQMQAQMALMQTQLSSAPKEKSSLVGKKIKCVNLAENPLNVSTEPSGMGRVYSFDKFGDSKLIKFDDVADIVASYPNTIEAGLFYIANKDAIKELELEDEYENILSKQDIDRVVYLRNDTDLEIFLGMSDIMKQSLSKRIARLYNANEKYDLNHFRKIKDDCGIDIEELAKDLKEIDIEL